MGTMKNIDHKILCTLAALATLPLSFQATSSYAASEANIQSAESDVIGTAEQQPSRPLNTTDETTIPESVFGSKRGYVHPYLTLQGKTTDNVFKGENDVHSDTTITISPGIWIALPKHDQVVLAVASANTAPGGLDLFLERPESFNRYQAYAFYGADIERYNTYTVRDNTKQNAEGFFQYNFHGGLSVNLYNKWRDSEDPLRTGGADTIDRYTNNLSGVVLDYDATEKLAFRADYNYFYLSYDEAFNAQKDRNDNRVALYATYSYSPKTKTFIEYDYTDISYDLSNTLNSQQNAVYAGINWSPTVSTKLIGKIGATHKDFDNANIDSQTKPEVELQINHDFTEKTRLQLIAKQKVNETTVSSASSQIKRDFIAQYTQLLTEKITGKALISYTYSDYYGIGGAPDDEESVLTLVPSVGYKFLDWLQLEAKYSYEKRNSDFINSDYDENAFYLSLSGWM